MADGSKTAVPSGEVVHQDLPPLKGLPDNLTYNDLIARNKRNSSFLVVLMIVIITLFGGSVGVIAVAWSGSQGENGIQLGTVLGGALVGGFLGLLASLIATAWSWFSGADAILRMTGSREIKKSDDPQLFNVVEELAIAGGVPLPRICVIDDPSLNAFATGRDPEHAAVAITSGLRKQLSRDELAGVMAHELSHIRHYDIRLGMLMATLAGIIVFAADAGGRAAYYSFLFGGRRGGGRSSGGGGANPLVIVIIVVAVIFAIIAPLCAMLVRFAMSRQREYLADAGAVELTRYPDGLIGALSKLENCRQPLRHVGKSTAPLFIVNPLKAAVRKGRHDASNAFSTHPPLSERIQRLRALKSG
ncbi:MAG: M48 family metalloprotease [Phycisphaerales bacterium]|nr:M48 family metalloprotease [Phycisphaerales bacterium]